MASLREQIRSNSVALISLSVALIALSYNTWRNETTESQRNIRQASFRVLESLGELQEVADYRYYYFPFEETHGREGELRLRGDGSHSDAAKIAEKELATAVKQARVAVIEVSKTLD